MADTALLLDLLDSAAPPGPLLTTKLYAPRRRANLMTRPRLVARLNQGIEQCKLILISAPTGFGKTTLLSEWLDQIDDSLQPSSLILQPFKVAWLSLDQEDNASIRFLSYLITALQTVQAGIGPASQSLLHSSQTPALEPVLTTLLNEVAAIPHDFALVLDDYHVIQAEAVHQILAFVLDKMPPQMHVIITSRADPPLPLGHLRARRQLLELRTADLRFTPPEAAAFLQQVMGLTLSAEAIDQLESRTEGWVAGLQLAALSLQGREAEAIPSVIAAFNGSHRYILDYLGEEVLQRQPGSIQTFLLQTSILDRLCGPLCDAVLGKDEGGRRKDEKEIISESSSLILAGRSAPGSPSSLLLEELEQANLFIIPLDDDRRWYRYHHLFADLLRNRLNQTQPDQVALLHRRAAEWFEQNGLGAEAMRHALTGADVDRAARLVEQNASTMLSRNEITTLLSWLDALPTEVIHSRPRLSLFQAWALVLTGQFDGIEIHLREAENHPGISGELSALRATMAYFRRDTPAAIALFREALELLPADNLFLRGAVALSLGVACSWSGDLAGASEAFGEASAISQITGNLHVALTALWNLAQSEIERGHLRRAAELCQRAIELAAEKSGDAERGQPIAAGGAHVTLASVFYEQNKLELALQHLQEGLKLGEQGAEVVTLAFGYITLARLRQAQADGESSLAAAQRAEQFAQRYDSPYWVAQAAAYQARLWIGRGQLELADRWAQAYPLTTDRPLDYLYEGEYFTLARLLLAQFRQARQQGNQAASRLAGELTQLLNRLLQAAEGGGRAKRVIEIRVLQALAHQAQGDTDQAVTMLQQALSLAEPEGWLRLFLDEGPPLAELLKKQKDKSLNIYATKLLAAFEAEQKLISAKTNLQPSSPAPVRGVSLQPLIEPLSERELEILQLIASGLSNQEIAEKVVVTVGTVKWHLNNIYGKLDARSRTQAVARARELGLL